MLNDFRKTIAILIVAGCAPAIILGCASSQHKTVSEETPFEPRPPQDGQTFVFECRDGFEFVAWIESDRACVFLPGETLWLPSVVSASGAKFSNGEVMLWTKGEEAMLEWKDVLHRSCRNNRAKAKWEHAKLTGFDFRAIGNEPGWTLEISGEHGIVFVTDYGETRYEFPYSKPEEYPEARKTVYRVSSGDSKGTIVLLREPCRDDMSGEPFPTTVLISLDDRAYRGCGKPLH